MDNPEDCSVCLNKYDESDRRPHYLPCGHTFCTLCINNLLRVGHVSCPTCRVTHQAANTTTFPIAYAVEAIIKKMEALKQTQISTPPSVSITDTASSGNISTVSAATGVKSKKQTTGMSRKVRSMKEEQINSVEGLLTGYQQYHSQLDQYSNELDSNKDEHLQQLDELYILMDQHKASVQQLQQEKTKVVAMKKEGEEGEQQLKDALEYLQNVNTAQEIITAIAYADYCSVEADEWTQQIREQFPDQDILTTSLKRRVDTRTALETLPAQEDGATQDTDTQDGDTQDGATKETDTQDGATKDTDTSHNITKQDPTLSIMDRVSEITKKVVKVEKSLLERLIMGEALYGVQQDQGHLRCSKISLDVGQVYFHCLRDEPLPSHVRILPVSEVLGLVEPSSILTFLDLAWGGSTRGRVHIRLRSNNTRGTQFILLCTGQWGPSYLNAVLLGVVRKGEPYECVYGGDYQYNNGEGGASLLTHSGNKDYPKSPETRIVGSKYGPDNNKMSSQFYITTKDWVGEWPYVFGDVDSGLEVLKAAINHNSNITDVTVVDCGVVLSL